MVTQSFQHQFMVDVVKESLDIKVHHKVIIEALALRLFDRIMCTFSRSVAERVWVEDGFQLLF